MFAVETEPAFAVNRRSLPDFPPVDDLSAVACLAKGESVFTASAATTASETLTVWLHPDNDAFACTSTDPRNGTICGNNPVNFRDPLGLERWTPVVHHIGRNGKIYDGAAFVRWYVDYLPKAAMQSAFTFSLDPGVNFLADVDIREYLQGCKFYYKGKCWEADEMGNIAAGYATRVWFTTPVSISMMFFVEVGNRENWSPPGNFPSKAWGSWSRNAIGGLVSYLDGYIAPW